MSTHTLIGPEGRKTRPCNAWCRDGRHAHLVFHGEPYNETTGNDLIFFEVALTLLNPGVTILGIEPAPEARPYEDTPPEARYGWVVHYRYPGEEV